MQKLTGLDASFLYLETSKSPMHIAGLSICKPPEGDFKPYEAFKAQIAERLHEIPAFRRVLKATPFNIDHPVWVEVDELDLDYHIQHMHLPAPGDAATLRTLIENLHGELLDRTRPLWRFYVIEGYEDAELGVKPGSFAIYTKSHHATIDGGSGISVMDIISDSEPTPRKPLPKSTVQFYKEEPGFFELLGNAYGRFVQSQADAVTKVPDLVKALGSGIKKTVTEGVFGIKDLSPAPKTPFNVSVEKDRTFGAQTLNLYEVISVGKATGTTVNDVVLSVCGGALRSYLEDLDCLPEKSLVAGVPISLREAGDSSQTNQVSTTIIKIASDVAEPLARLKAVKEHSARAKDQINIFRDILPTDYSIFGAPVAVSLVSQLIGDLKVMDRAPSMVNLAISNVPGPRHPMYFAGSRVTAYFPVSIATHGVALNITVHSYTHRLDFGVIGDRIAVPNIQSIAENIYSEFEALKKAVAADLAKKGETLQGRPPKKAKKPTKAANEDRVPSSPALGDRQPKAS